MISRHVHRALASGLLVLVALISAPGIAQAQARNASTPVAEVAPSTAAAPLSVQAPPAFRWTGFYIGGSAGYGGGKADTTFLPQPNTTDVLAPDTLFPDTMGWAYGFYGGMNFQGGIFVAGAEADIMFSVMDGSQQYSNFKFGGATVEGAMSAAQTVDWYSTVRGRAGVGVAGVLVYGTAGVAIERLDHSSNISGGGFQYPVDQVDTKYGWTIGGGVEGKFNRRVTWRAQYLRLDLGSTTATGNPVPANPPFTINQTWISTSNVFTAGIGFKF